MSREGGEHKRGRPRRLVEIPVGLAADVERRAGKSPSRFYYVSGRYDDSGDITDAIAADVESALATLGVGHLQQLAYWAFVRGESYRRIGEQLKVERSSAESMVAGVHRLLIGLPSFGWITAFCENQTEGSGEVKPAVWRRIFGLAE